MNRIVISLFAGVFSVSSVLAQVHFRPQTIDDKVGIGYGVAIADVNGDKKPDILLVDKAEISWYENPSWTKHVIAEKLTQLDHVCIAADDIDGDGKAEIAVGAGWNPGDTVNSGAVFYLIPPADRTQKWTPVELPHEPTVHRMWWVNRDLFVLPLHGRGNKNGQGEPVKMLEYIRPADPRQPWETHVVPNLSIHMAHNFDPRGALGFLVGAREGVFRISEGKGVWRTEQLIGAETQGFLGAGEVRSGKLPNGREFITTVEPMHGTNFVVYLPEPGKSFKRILLDDKINDGHALAAANLLGGKGDQIVAGWRGKNAEGKVGIKLYTTSHDGEHWTSEWVDDNGMACEDLRVADLDGDGRPEIVASGRATKNLKIYWNENGKSKKP
jgi:hypothetical protein